ncbi:MAG TPA: SGNH/GDSL hydrolase family protein [Chthoniobacterales bacterium]
MWHPVLLARLGTFIFCFVFLGQVRAASPAQYDQLVVFGDSLSDTGNTFAAAGLPQPPYYDGRWTNGPNWVDYFAPMAGLPTPTAYLRYRGTNFAVGGATSEYAAGEIATYVAVSGGYINPNNLYVLWIGANDFRAGLTAQQTLQFIQTELVSLTLAGAKHIIVVNVPDISLTPDVRAAGGATIAAAKQFVTTVDVGLQNNLPYLGLVLGTNIALVDVNLLFNELVYNPAAFGFANSTGSAFNPNTGQVLPSPDLYVFWDGFHPTTYAHRLAAITILTGLTDAGGTNPFAGWLTTTGF